MRKGVGKNMGLISSYLVPILLFATAAWALGKKEDPYDLLLQGGREGLQLLWTLVPTLVPVSASS